MTSDSVLDLTAYDANLDPNASPVLTDSTGLNDATGSASLNPLSDLYNFATSTFKQVTSAAINIYQADQLAKLQQAQSQAQVARQQALSPPYTAAQKTTISLASIGAVVLLSTAFLLIRRRKRRG